MKDKKLVLAIVLGASFVLASVVLGVSYFQTKKPVKTVSVVGLAEKDFTSDLIVWNLSYEVLDSDMKQSYNLLKKQNEIVRSFLKKKGIQDAEVDFLRSSNTPSYDSRWENNRWVEYFLGYKARQSVRITSKDVDKVEKLIREISELYDQNIQISSSEPEYYYTKLADLKLEMIAQASKNAKDRAEAVTQNAGSKLGGLKTATMGVFQITAPNSSEDDYTWGGAFNTSSKQKRVSINMRLTYYVK